jgi:hypothetical protein
MSIAQIEAELKRMSAAELRHLAMSSWAAFLEKEGLEPEVNECDETDPDLLAALDEAVRRADRSDKRPLTGNEVRSRVREWTTK